jgi:hypothetical protein
MSEINKPRDGRRRLCYAIRFIVAANLRFAVKIQDIGKPEARRHEIRRKAAILGLSESTIVTTTSLGAFHPSGRQTKRIPKNSSRQDLSSGDYGQ